MRVSVSASHTQKKTPSDPKEDRGRHCPPCCRFDVETPLSPKVGRRIAPGSMECQTVHDEYNQETTGPAAQYFLKARGGSCHSRPRTAPHNSASARAIAGADRDTSLTTRPDAAD